jgi:hypothetical protein
MAPHDKKTEEVCLLYMNWLKLLLVGLMFTYHGYVMAKSGSDTMAEIDFLKSEIIHSSCVFTRNGVDYQGSEAITHINRKQLHFKDKITTTEDFVRLAASKSEMSGLNYTVRCDHQKENLGNWLLKKLAMYRKQAKH